MKAIDKLIFNLLATRRGFNLPMVGSLSVERRAARATERHRIEPPQNRIVFSKKENPGQPTLCELIARAAEVDIREAQRLYNGWLDQARSETGILIEGAGEIRQDFFKPSSELNQLLNPAGKESLTLKRRKQTGKTALIGVSILACGGIVAALLSGDFTSPKPASSETISSGPPTTSARPALPADTALTNQPATSGSKIDTLRQDSIRSDSNPSRKNDTDPNGIVPVSSELYYVVAGVYSTEKNAETFIAKAQDQHPNMHFTKVRMRNGKIIVSVFSSADQTEAERERARLSSQDPDLWIYKRKQ